MDYDIMCRFYNEIIKRMATEKQTAHIKFSSIS